jgi:CXXC-20-CXXC protein
MKIRTCPSCGYKYPLKVYYRKLIFKFIDSKWYCENCNSVLTFNFGRRILVILIAMLPVLIYNLIRTAWSEHLYMPKWLSYIILGMVTFIWVLIIAGFDTFSEVDKK